MSDEDPWECAGVGKAKGSEKDDTHGRAESIRSYNYIDFWLSKSPKRERMLHAAWIGKHKQAFILPLFHSFPQVLSVDANDGAIHTSWQL